MLWCIGSGEAGVFREDHEGDRVSGVLSSLFQQDCLKGPGDLTVESIGVGLPGDHQLGRGSLVITRVTRIGDSGEGTQLGALKTSPKKKLFSPSAMPRVLETMQR